MLAAAGFDSAALKCGPHWPLNQTAAQALAPSDATAGPIHNNCSGKHAGFLCVACAMAADSESYFKPDHPVQRAVRAVLENLSCVVVDDNACAIDGCSVPTWALPLSALARAMARFGSGQGLSPTRAQAAARLRQACTEQPWHVAGTGRFCTEMMRTLGPRAFVKTGAEGVFCAALPDQSLGVAVKCDDGSGRAAEVILAAAVSRFLTSDADRVALERFVRPTLRNWNGTVVAACGRLTRQWRRSANAHMIRCIRWDRETRDIMRSRIRCIAGVLMLSAAVQPASADAIADFYRGKTVSIVVGHQAGTGFDIYSRALAPHFGRHIPGNPNVIVQNMVGASGLTAANWLANVAPKDGTVVATFVHTVAFEPVFGNDKAQYDPAKLSWIGSLETSTGLCGVTQASGFTKFDELLAKEAVFGATGATGPLGTFAQAVRNVTGAKMKVVYGYKGSADVKLAMNRNEVHGICGLPLTTIKSFWADEYKTGAFKPVLQLNGPPTAELKDIPHIDSFAKTASDKQVFNLIFGAQALGRPYVSPPGQPAERTKALRDAMAAAVKDDRFLAEATRAKIDIELMPGEDVASMITRFSAVSPEVVAQAKQSLARN